MVWLFGHLTIKYPHKNLTLHDHQWKWATVRIVNHINHHHPSSHDYPLVGFIFTLYHHQYILASSLSAQWHLYTLLTWFPCPTYIIFITIIIITSFWICSRDLPNRRKYSGKLLILLRPKLKIWSKKKLSMSSHLKCNLTDKRKKCLRHLGSSLREVLSNISSASGKSLYEVALICILTLRRAVRLNVALSDTKPRRGREWNS